MCIRDRPTAIHFFAATMAMAFYKNHNEALKMAEVLEKNREHALSFDDPQMGAAVTADYDARRFAFIHLYLYPFFIFIVSLTAIIAISVYLFNLLPSWMGLILSTLH